MNDLMIIKRSRTEIFNLKNKLKNNDYKIIKCFEYSLNGKNAPYDVNALHVENETTRAKINTLQAELNTLNGGKINVYQMRVSKI